MFKLNWHKVPDGKPNEQTAIYHQVYITVYSDKEHREWTFFLGDDKDELFGPFSTMEAAVKEACSEIDFDMTYGTPRKPFIPPT